jgi:regulator of PEP synthase PpsR (kinase-PPPase family)
MQYGIFAANYPLTDDDLESRKLPGALESHGRKLFGLTIKADRLQQIRNERRPDSRYSSINQVAFEVRAAESLFERNGIPVIDATECSIEEISSRILDRTGIERRLRP